MGTFHDRLPRAGSEVDPDVSPPRLYVVPDRVQPSDRDDPGDSLGRTEGPSESPGDPKRQKIKATSTPKDWQLPLPLGDAQSGATILIVSMDAMNGATLRGLISEWRPDSAVDLREMIRFEIPGTSREDVFRTLRIHQTHYVPDPLPWHRLDARAWALLEAPISSKLVHEIAERSPACVFVFVQKHDEVRSIAAHLTKVLSERMRGPWHIEEAS